MLQTYKGERREEHGRTGADFIHFPPGIDSLVDKFVSGLHKEPKFLEDTKSHDASIRQMNYKIFKRHDKITQKELKQAITDYVMIKPPNRNDVFDEIDINFPKVKKFLAFLAKFSGDTVMNVNELCNKSSALKIRGSGIFFITQLLAAAHPDLYVVFETNVLKALNDLDITDILEHNVTGNRYIYINEVCKKLYHDKLKNRLKQYDLGMSAPTHNFLWHYYANYRRKGIWS